MTQLFVCVCVCVYRNPINGMKNRYKDVGCFDHTRVQLERLEGVAVSGNEGGLCAVSHPHYHPVWFPSCRLIYHGFTKLFTLTSQKGELTVVWYMSQVIYVNPLDSADVLCCSIRIAAQLTMKCLCPICNTLKAAHRRSAKRLAYKNIQRVATNLQCTDTYIQST